MYVSGNVCMCFIELFHGIALRISLRSLKLRAEMCNASLTQFYLW